MQIDNLTLFNLLLVQALISAMVLSILMGTRVSAATRGGQVFMGLQALGWLAVAGSAQGAERLLMTAGMVCLSASLSVLWWSLQTWLTPRPGRIVMFAVPVLMPLVYALQYPDTVFRVGWAHYWIALQLAMLAVQLCLPNRRIEQHEVPAADNRRWRALLLLAVLPLIVICVLRGSLGIFRPALQSPLNDEAISTVLGLLCQWALTLSLIALVLAWRGETEGELARLAQTDGLTGLSDRRAFAGRALEMISMARRHREPLALMILDIDNLKLINVENDREAGDRALALFASCVQAQMRLGDLAGRVGGEEFAVLMARCDAQGPEAMDKRMRDALALRAQKELGFAVDFSAGWAKLRHGDRSIDDLMRRAETALYEAKRTGRGQLLAEPGLESCPTTGTTETPT